MADKKNALKAPENTEATIKSLVEKVDQLTAEKEEQEQHFNRLLHEANETIEFFKSDKAYQEIVQELKEANKKIYHVTTDVKTDLITTLSDRVIELEGQLLTLNDPENTLIKTAQLTTLINQNWQLKEDIAPLINVFATISPLIKGSGALAIAAAIPRIMGNKELLGMIEKIGPVIEKYTVNAQKTLTDGN